MSSPSSFSPITSSLMTWDRWGGGSASWSMLAWRSWEGFRLAATYWGFQSNPSRPCRSLFASSWRLLVFVGPSAHWRSEETHRSSPAKSCRSSLITRISRAVRRSGTLAQRSKTCRQHLWHPLPELATLGSFIDRRSSMWKLSSWYTKACSGTRRILHPIRPCRKRCTKKCHKSKLFQQGRGSCRANPHLRSAWRTSKFDWAPGLYWPSPSWLVQQPVTLRPGGAVEIAHSAIIGLHKIHGAQWSPSRPHQVHATEEWPLGEFFPHRTVGKVSVHRHQAALNGAAAEL